MSSDAVGALHGVYQIIEATRGTTPNTPAMTYVHNTSFDFSPSATAYRSEEIRSDAEVSDTKLGPIGSTGSMAGELGYGTHNFLLEAALSNDGVGTGYTHAAFGSVSGTDITAAASDQSFADASNGLGSIAVGDWVKVAGFTTAANNGVFRVATAAAGKITVDLKYTYLTGAIAASAVEDESSGDSITITQEKWLTPSYAQRGYSFIRKIDEWSTPGGLTFPGCTLGDFGLSAAINQYVKFTSNWQGWAPTDGLPAGATYGDEGDAAPLTMIGGTIYENNLAIAYVTGINISIKYALYPQDTVNSTSRRDLLRGGRTAQGNSLRLWWPSNDLFTKFTGRTESALQFDMYGPLGSATQTLRCLLPRIFFTNWSAPKGADGPIEQTVGFDILRDQTFDFSIAFIDNPSNA